MAKRPRNPINGWINLYKPAGIGSTQALGRVKRALNPAKAGHAGTLDPLASGILPIALGEATKTVPFMQDRDKTYRFTVQWGAATSTDDSEGEVTQTSDHRPTIEEINAILPEFTGCITQIPPRFSAVKIDGQRAYDLARAGKDFEIKTRNVEIYELQCLQADQDSADFECRCGKGTYVRSLARDMAVRLGTFGHITRLQRIAVGPMRQEDAISLDFFDEIEDKDAVNEVLLPLETVLDDIPALPLEGRELQDLRQGRVLTFIAPHQLNRLKAADLEGGNGETAAIFSPTGQCSGLVSVTGVKVKPERLFNL